MKYKFNFNIISFVVVAVGIWQCSFLFTSIVQYQALNFVFNRGTTLKKRLANAAVMWWFAEIWLLFWAVDLLSFVKSDVAIVDLLQNTSIIFPTYCCALPTKVFTIRWWKSLKARKPMKEVDIVMRCLLCIMLFRLAQLYLTICGCFIWTCFVQIVLPCSRQTKRLF